MIGNNTWLFKTQDIEHHNIPSSSNINTKIKCRRVELAEHAACKLKQQSRYRPGVAQRVPGS
jgi:hypothetical protein